MQALTDLQSINRSSGRVQDVASESRSDSHGGNAREGENMYVWRTLNPEVHMYLYPSPPASSPKAALLIFRPIYVRTTIIPATTSDIGCGIPPTCNLIGGIWPLTR